MLLGFLLDCWMLKQDFMKEISVNNNFIDPTMYIYVWLFQASKLQNSNIFNN